MTHTGSLLIVNIRHGRAASSAAQQLARTASVCGGNDVDGNNTNCPLADGSGINMTPDSVVTEGMSY